MAQTIEDIIEMDQVIIQINGKIADLEEQRRFREAQIRRNAGVLEEWRRNWLENDVTGS